MKTILTLFIFSLFSFTSKAQWIELDTGLENPPVFNDVYAITPEIVVVVGANGTILKTTDGGDTWMQKSSGSTANLGRVRFPTTDIGYVSGGGGGLLKTIDSGETWSVVDTGIDCFPYSFSCVDENLIFSRCSNGNLAKTEDGGDTWNIVGSIPYTGRMQFLNSDIGFLWSEQIGLSKTVNGGETWEELLGGPIYFVNQNTGFLINDSALYKTTDLGNNFLFLCSSNWGAYPTIFAPDENNVWGILGGLLDGDGSTRGIGKFYSEDGENFTEVLALENNVQLYMNSIHFADENTGYIVGSKISGGAIWKNGTGINTMSTSDYEIKDKIKIYPNPASSEINIVLDNLGTNNYTISLTDMTGKQIYSDSFRESKIKINTSMFSKGIYILKVNSHSQKIIIN